MIQTTRQTRQYNTSRNTQRTIVCALAETIGSCGGLAAYCLLPLTSINSMPVSLLQPSGEGAHPRGQHTHTWHCARRNSNASDPMFHPGVAPLPGHNLFAAPAHSTTTSEGSGDWKNTSQEFARKEKENHHPQNNLKLRVVVMLASPFHLLSVLFVQKQMKFIQNCDWFLNRKIEVPEVW